MEKKYIRFDWAMKRLLRNKANFGVLEGFLTTLLEQPIHIKSLLESESNQESEYDKYNRVDMLAENDKGQLFIIEVQNNNEYAYFQRILFGTSKLITEYIERGCPYENIRKIYSINIIYFALGKGNDTVYHGKTEFRGIHSGELLRLSPFQQARFNASEVSDLYPEYYILKVNGFDSVAKTPLEEWIYYLNTGVVSSDATAPGLDKVRTQLTIDAMSKAEREAYFRHVDNIVILQNNVETEREEGRFEGHAKGLEEGLEKGRAKGLEEGRAKGLEEGLEKGRAEGLEEGLAKGESKKASQVIRNALALGMDDATILSLTGITPQELARLKG